jgi:hypothetical protein
MVAFREAGYALQLQQQKDVLDNFRTHFDVWYVRAFAARDGCGRPRDGQTA